MKASPSGRIGVAAAALVLVLAGTASAAFVGLPADGSQVNNDPAAGIDPHQNAEACPTSSAAP